MSSYLRDALILNPCANGSEGCVPSQDPWRPASNSQVVIANDSGHEQVLSNITSGLLNPSPGNTITIPAGQAWVGTVSNKSGTYVYNDCSDSAGPRDGTIDPS